MVSVDLGWCLKFPVTELATIHSICCLYQTCLDCICLTLLNKLFKLYLWVQVSIFFISIVSLIFFVPNLTLTVLHCWECVEFCVLFHTTKQTAICPFPLQGQMMFQWSKWQMLVLEFVARKAVRRLWLQILLWGSFASWKDYSLYMDIGIISGLAIWFYTTSTEMLFSS